MTNIYIYIYTVLSFNRMSTCLLYLAESFIEWLLCYNNEEISESVFIKEEISNVYNKVNLIFG